MNILNNNMNIMSDSNHNNNNSNHIDTSMKDNTTTNASNSNSNNTNDYTNYKTVLVTGGCGYIGSHTIVVLLQNQYNVVVIDNLCNSSSISLDRVATICNLSKDERNIRLKFYQIDLCNEIELNKIFQLYSKTAAKTTSSSSSEDNMDDTNTNTTTTSTYQVSLFHCIIHFAGLKAVGESTRIPIKYYENNLISTFNLLKCMELYHCHSIVFSSSATVYGAADTMPITEDTQVGVGITNAYGRTKYMIEEILNDYYNSKNLNTSTTTTNGNNSNPFSITILRYFNPVGAHSSGMIGEDPNGIPNNLMPYVSQVAVGRRPFLTIFGNDYPTIDGTGVRDYLHVMDLAEGHLSALQYMDTKSTGIFTFNLGTGNGYSVLQMCEAMSKACGHEIKYEIGSRRTGDIAICYADPTKAYTEMKWKATRDLDEMCRDLWSWQSNNPNGFEKK